MKSLALEIDHLFGALVLFSFGGSIFPLSKVMIFVSKFLSTDSITIIFTFVESKMFSSKRLYAY